MVRQRALQVDLKCMDYLLARYFVLELLQDDPISVYGSVTCPRSVLRSVPISLYSNTWLVFAKVVFCFGCYCCTCATFNQWPGKHFRSKVVLCDGLT